MTGKPQKWTDDKIKLLKQLYMQGDTLQHIADRLDMGLTPNAVKLKAHYLGFPSRPGDTRWTPEVETYLRERWAEGWSGGKIAEGIQQKWSLVFTRSAIIGKAHRMNLGPHANAGGVNLRAERKLTRKRQGRRGDSFNMPLKPHRRPLTAFQTVPLPKEPEPSNFASTVKFEDLDRDDMCRFIVKHEGGTAHYCGEKTLPGQSWCPGCHARVFLPKITLKRRKDWTSETEQKIKELQRLIAE
jgi:hypothetical protein